MTMNTYANRVPNLHEKAADRMDAIRTAGEQ
jgi:hypothetical protein